MVERARQRCKECQSEPESGTNEAEILVASLVSFVISGVEETSVRASIPLSFQQGGIGNWIMLFSL